MTELLELVELRPILGDGAMGTMLLARGLQMGDCPEAWNLDHPDVVKGIHDDYVAASCDFIETNTFGANPIKLSRFALEGKIEEIIASAVDIARRAAGERCMVAASIGPTGALLQPYGDISREKVADAFRVTARLVEKAGVDFFIVETMSDLEEAKLAIGAIKEYSRKPIVATMAFSKGAKGYRSMMGATPQQAALALVDAGAHLVGTNCCAGPLEAAEILSEMRQTTDCPLVAQPNAGLPKLEGGNAIYPETPESFAAGMEKVLAEGASIIGGCCGTTPEHIREIALLMGKC